MPDLIAKCCGDISEEESNDDEENENEIEIEKKNKFKKVTLESGTCEISKDQAQLKMEKMILKIGDEGIKKIQNLIQIDVL